MDLNRFLKAQKRVYPIALDEIKQGRKQSHWIWYIFPQLNIFGSSFESLYYGIHDLDQAKAYMANDYLRGNLLEITRALLALESTNPVVVMGSEIDAIKLRSSMTLFMYATPEYEEFKTVLDKYFDGTVCSRTVEFVIRSNT